jgi:hypothetical protein
VRAALSPSPRSLSWRRRRRRLGGHRCRPTRQAPRSSSAPSSATSTTRYAHPLAFPSCCAKPTTQTLTYYLYSDLIQLRVYMHGFCLLASISFAKVIGWCPSPGPPLCAATLPIGILLTPFLHDSIRFLVSSAQCKADRSQLSTDLTT